MELTVADLIAKLNAKEICISDSARKVKGGYAGDFLSNVMGKAPTDCCWFTVMANVNVVAVATLADVSLVVICEGVEPDDSLVQKAKVQGVNIVSVKEDVYNAVIKSVR
ncbi:MAG: hypothetical protein IKM44_00830 [Clostridia bacterium]|nr:hypothetical protein [Clostridia bacterium]